MFMKILVFVQYHLITYVVYEAIEFPTWLFYEKAVIAINKIDIATEKEIVKATKALPSDWPVMRISAFKDIGLEELKDFIYDNLGFMRVFLKPQGQEADLEEPLIVKDDSTVEHICNKLHRDFVRKFRFGRIKGPVRSGLAACKTLATSRLGFASRSLSTFVGKRAARTGLQFTNTSSVTAPSRNASTGRCRKFFKDGSS